MFQITSNILATVLILSGVALAESAPDPRNITSGLPIPSEGYCDQPYVVITQDGHWLCTMTTGKGREGDPGQHIISMISADHGHTWSKPVAIEPADGPQASWAMPLVTDFGRVYVFYDYNGDNVKSLPGNERETKKPLRADMLGWYCYRYSDDGGQTWSKQRYRLPVRETSVDRNNNWKGAVQIFWGIGKPIHFNQGHSAIFGFAKLGRYLLDQGEGWFFRSDNILSERDADKLEWKMLPESDHGVRAEEFGSVQEEHNLVELSDGTLYCVYRTALGHPCCAISHDGGRTWSKPEPVTYADGRLLKHPRACPRVFKCANGKYLLWFHNNGEKSTDDRNPAWVAGGIEVDGRLQWSEPEILLYDDAPKVKMSYPDLIEQEGKYFLTETQKKIARVHTIDPTLLQGLWNQPTNRQVAATPVLDLRGEDAHVAETRLTKLVNLDERRGFSIEMAVTFELLEPGQLLLDNRDATGKGLLVSTTDQKTVAIVLNDGAHKCDWDCDAGLLSVGKTHHLVINVDAGARIIMFIVDGRLCDGGTQRAFGWGRIDPQLTDINGGMLKIGTSLKGRISLLRIYDRCLRTSEAVGNFKSTQ